MPHTNMNQRVEKIISIENIPQEYHDIFDILGIPGHPIIRDQDDIIRFKIKPMMKYLADKIDLNHMWRDYLEEGVFTEEEFKQFYRDMGYSLDGFMEVWGEEA